MTYSGVPGDATLEQWLHLLSQQTTCFAAQPYTQLATAHASAGNEREARRVHMARQRDLVRRGSLSRFTRIWYRITGLTVGYGYRPSAALLWLLGTLTLAVALVTLVAAPAHGFTGLVRKSS